MAINPTQLRPFKTGVPATVQAITLAAPTGGIDTRSALASMSGDNSIYSYNLTVQEGAVAVRPGYREWALGLDDGITANLGVKTLIPHTTAGFDSLWAVTNEGIWNVTDYNTAPVQELSPNQTGQPADDWTITTEDAGYGVFTALAADNGDEYVFYADSKNGLFVRNLTNLTTPLWERTTFSAAGASDPAVNNSLINFIVVHKQRLWFAEQDSNHAHYAGIGAVTGNVEAFFFGSKFKYGGGIAGLFNWTVDGGAGVDDYLVAVGEGGDLIPYRGIDPTQDDWANVGSYYIGKPPIGGNFASEYAGELYFLSSFGVIAMSDILKGVDLGDSNRNPNSLSFLITKVIRKDVALRGTQYGWQMAFVPSRGDLIIATPSKDINNPIQYVLNLSLGAWSYWRDIPMTSFVDWQGKLFIGVTVPTSPQESGKVAIMDVARDNVLITPLVGIQNGSNIDFSILSSFSKLGQDAVYKRVQYVRSDFLAVTKPVTEIKTLYNYDINEPTRTDSTEAENNYPVGVWDVDDWDAAIWGAGLYDPAKDAVSGGYDMGRTVAIALRGSSGVACTFIGWDISWIAGQYAL